MKNYCDLILPVPMNRTYTYLVPEGLRDAVRPGAAAQAELGSRKLWGIVASVREMKEEDCGGIRIKPLLACRPSEPLATEPGLRLWQWICDYYLCSPGSVMSAALPSCLLGGTYKPKSEVYLRPAGIDYEGRLSPGQKDCLRLLEESCADGPVAKRELAKAVSPSSLSNLIKKGLIEEYSVEVSRFAEEPAGEALKTLTEEQRQAMAVIKGHFAASRPVLLHGVPASGKTEIYKHLIQEVLDGGGQALYLVPEILLGTQLSDRLRKVFGGRLFVWHSQVSDDKKAEIYLRARSGEPMVILGARSAVFAPLTKARLIIVDEEHDGSYKQDDPSPRYNARNVAVMLGALSGCNVLLGTATPSLETYHNAMKGKYGLAELKHGYAAGDPPQIEIVDLSAERRKRKMKGLFSFGLLAAMEQTIAAGEQIILFHSRKGYSTYTSCTNCSWVPRCPNCGVSLVYHQKTDRLRCHYCGYASPLPQSCPDCGSEIKQSGAGTEKVMSELHALYPDWRLMRIDADICKGPADYRRIIDGFDGGGADVLIGTQILVKGLDFKRVGLVGIVNADLLLDFPDFRSVEKSFQTFLQVAGRAGRAGGGGRLILQTRKPDYPVLPMLESGDYRAFYELAAAERREFHYPPFYRMIRIDVLCRDFRRLADICADCARSLRGIFSEGVMGPFIPTPSRRNLFYVNTIMIKIPTSEPYFSANKRIASAIDAIRQKWIDIRISVDVDPF